VLGLLIVVLHNSVFILVPWPFFFVFLLVKRRYKWSNIVLGAIQYSLMAAIGLYELIFWSLDAVGDVSQLLFHYRPHVMTVFVERWANAPHYLKLTILLVLFLAIYSIVCYFLRRNTRARH
jgi:hypothetical protein